MYTKKDILNIILTILGGGVAMFLVVLLICEVAPFFILLFVFIPWLGEALKNGSNVK